jgi:hypothetical protein
MSDVSFARLSSAPPPLRELLEAEADGAWTAWRSNGAIVGRFAGRSEAAARLVEIARSAARDDPSPADHDTSTLDGATDSLEVEGVTVEIGHGDAPDDPWGRAFAAARDLLGAATEYPLAAFALVVSGPGEIRLEQRGPETLEVELGSAGVELTSFDAKGIMAASSRSAIDLGRVEAGPGWRIDLPHAAIDAADAAERLVELSFVAVDDGVYVPMLLSVRMPAA